MESSANMESIKIKVKINNSFSNFSHESLQSSHCHHQIWSRNQYLPWE